MINLNDILETIKMIQEENLDIRTITMGIPEDVAKAMVYLSEAEFVTGQVLPVNGGFII